VFPVNLTSFLSVEWEMFLVILSDVLKHTQIIS
jgi:hypothetical protein